MSVNHSQWTTQYHIWYLGELTLQGEADVCVRGLEDEEVGPQHSLWTGGGPALPSETPANSGKSDIFTSNGTRSICAGLDIPAKFGADLVPLKPVVQSQSKLDEKWIKVRETVCRKKKNRIRELRCQASIREKLTMPWVTSTFFLCIQWALAH